MTLANGTTIELPTGQIKLKEYRKANNGSINNLIPYIFSDHDLGNKEIKNTLRVFCKTINSLTEEVNSLKSINKKSLSK